MRIIKGNNYIEMTAAELNKAAEGCEDLFVDLGTGDGRFVYESALDSPQNFYVGVDPSHKQLEIYSKKALRKKLSNTLFVQGSIESYPSELLGSASGLYIILPWGTLLQKTADPSPEVLEFFRNTLREGGFLEIVLGYSEESDPSETERLKLPPINERSVNEVIVPRFTSGGFDLEFVRGLDKEGLKVIKSSWSKRLAFGQNRPLFHLKFRKNRG
jgi:16S rRNA (adenine(1408)-N(1))-methyltransferase